MAGLQLLDAFGRPIQRAVLKDEIGVPTLGGVRNPIAGYPADGITPLILAEILREADMGNPVRYLELAETIEERDPHYLGVLGTRKRSVAQVEIQVDAGSEDPEDERIAQEVRDWIKRDELSDELFDILDCIGKGFSVTEILWEQSERQWMPVRLEKWDPRWIRFDRASLRTPMRLDDAGQEIALDPFKFIFATIKAKSGLALRSGLSRVAAWGWMFKAFTQRDWAMFCATYGQPVRLGKYDPGASAEDKAVLWRAVANIAGDCAAIIPASMQMEFVQAANIGAAHQLYIERCDWLDQQISKAVLGQTSTTDAVVGGLGSGKEHRQVQKDIQTADCRALAAILNRDLIRPWVQLNHGPRKAYPRIRIEEVEEEDLKALAEALAPMIDRGLEVEQATILSRFGIAEAKTGAKMLRPMSAAPDATAPVEPTSKIKRVSDEIKRGQPLPGTTAAPQAEGPLAGIFGGSDETDPVTLLADRMTVEAQPAVGVMIGQIEVMLAAAGSLGEFREMLLAGFPKLDATALADALARGMLAADASGRVSVLGEAGTAE